MNITTRTNGSDAIVEVDGWKVAEYDYVECDLQHARMQAEAFAEGLRQGIKMTLDNPQKPLFLFSWTSEAVSDGVYAGTLAAMAPDVDTAREMITKAAADQVKAKVREISFSQLEEDLERTPTINTNQAFVFGPE